MDEEYDKDGEEDAAVQLVIDGVLDLHPFSPKDLKYLIPDYIAECLERNILELRIIHGKGKGNIRRSVHALLDRNPHVQDYRTGDLDSGGWGATVVLLKK
ncbi:Smr/MutS family protein [Desulforhopalus sp. IMCC35007]|uniref:Smr/MutS family protein n=1 Tax=Desulforhopalus sp. IMCC35007 TaxID=2569543 RepID=UPI0010AE44E6|nr:Smr/MutS family protein [Desulforhopalus sp. IMCC35007]TKB11110.1 DNA mismatch repair protein MutS [Desulforhopalus sp. IMCC35007]